MRILMNVRTRIAALSVLSAFAVAGVTYAQFSPPTCVPPNCNPEVIQNIALGGSPQAASFNITGDGGIGAKFEAGRQAPTLGAATDYLYFGNVNASSSAGYLMALQTGGADRFKVNIAGQTQVPTGSAASPSYSYLTDTNTGMYASAADSIAFATNGVARTVINNSGTTINSGVLSLPTGSAAAPSLTFSGDTNTGIYRSAADTFNIATAGVSRFQIGPTGIVTIPGDLTVSGTISGTVTESDTLQSVVDRGRASSTTAAFGSGAVASDTAGVSARGSNMGVYAVGTDVGTSYGVYGNGGLYGVRGDSGASGYGVYGNANTGVYGYSTGAAGYAGYFANGGGGTGVYASGSTGLRAAGSGASGIGGYFSSGGTETLRVVAPASGNAINVRNNADSATQMSISYLGTVSMVNQAGFAELAFTGDVPTNLTSHGQIYVTVDSDNDGSESFIVQGNSGSNMLSVYESGSAAFWGPVSAAGLTITKTAEQLRLAYDAANYASFTINAAGDLTIAPTGGDFAFTGNGAFTGNLTVAGQSVCRADGTNCPATLTGGGTADYVTKFTGSGSTVGNSQIQDNGSTVGVGIAPQSAKLYVNGTIAANNTISSYQVAAGGVGISGQVVGVGSYGVSGNGGSYGVYGSSGGYGVYGINTSAGAGGAGVYGYGDGTSPGVQGSSLAGWGGSFSSLYVSPGTAYFASAVTLNGGATLGAGSGLTLGTNAGDIAGSNGTMSYNTATNKFRCYENGAWVNCINNPNAWSTINASAGTDPVPDSTADTLNISGGTAITVTGDAGSDTITIANSGVTSAVAGAGISVSGATGAVTITNTGDTNAADDLTGSGTANYLPKFTGATSFGNSQIYDNGTNVGVGTASPNYPLSLGSTTGNTKLALYETGAGNAYGLGVIPGALTTHLNSAAARFGWFDNASLTTEVMTLQGSGTLRVSGAIGANGYSPNSTWGITTGGSGYGGVFYGGSYGVYASGSTYALYGSGNGYVSGEMGIGTGSTTDYQLTVWNDANAYAYLGRKDGGINGKGIMAYGDYYGGYFNDTNGTAYLYAAWGGYGAYGLGSTSGGYFANTSGGGTTYIGGYNNGWTHGVYVGSGNTYGIVGYGASTGARFYDSDGTATVFLAGASWAVEVISGSAGKPGGGSWSSTSDARTKKDVSPYTDGLSVIRRLDPVNYTYNGLGGTPDGLKGIGFIAQDVKDIVPYMVKSEMKKLRETDEKETEVFYLDPSAMDFLNLNAIKDLDLRIDGLEAKVEKRDEEQDAKIRELERKIEELEARVDRVGR